MAKLVRVERVRLEKIQTDPALGFPWKICYSARRRSLCIEVRQGQVLVRAPAGLSETIIRKFVAQKAQWVCQKVAEQQARGILAPVEKNYATGSKLPFMDEQLTLVIGYGALAAIQRINNELHLLLSTRSRKGEQQQIKELLARWYQAQALGLLSAKTHLLAQQLGLRCSEVKVKATRSKWGHCTIRGAIQYNWHILLAPQVIVDYLVAHEVSHLQHHNHSPDFWALVARVCPDYKMRRLWLKQQAIHLVL